MSLMTTSEAYNKAHLVDDIILKDLVDALDDKVHKNELLYSLTYLRTIKTGIEILESTIREKLKGTTL